MRRMERVNVGGGEDGRVGFLTVGPVATKIFGSLRNTLSVAASTVCNCVIRDMWYVMCDT